MQEYGIRLDPVVAQQSEPKMTEELSAFAEGVAIKSSFESGKAWKNLLAFKQLKRLVEKG